MLTSYLVRCPHSGCDWFGSLLPSRDADSWRGCAPTTSTAVFECPRCGREWRARVKGDDVIPFPVDDLMHVDS
jgi:hypothetical protein